MIIRLTSGGQPVYFMVGAIACVSADVNNPERAIVYGDFTGGSWTVDESADEIAGQIMYAISPEEFEDDEDDLGD